MHKFPGVKFLGHRARALIIFIYMLTIEGIG